MQTDQSTRTEHQQITSRAYFLWEQAGRPEGRDIEFWLQAEKEAARSTEAQPLLRDHPPARRTRPIPLRRANSRSRMNAPIKAAWQI